jgi:hypothetical protein
LQIRIRDLFDPGSEIFFAWDPGWKNSDPGSGMEKFRSGMENSVSGSGKNILDPQHCIFIGFLVKYLSNIIFTQNLY